MAGLPDQDGGAVPYLEPWAPPFIMPVAAPGDIVYLSPGMKLGLPYLAGFSIPLEMPELNSGRMAYFAPALIDGMPFLAPPLVPVTLILPESVVGGRGRAARSSARASATRAKSSPQVDANPYHSRAYEQDERAAAELDDEETVIAYLMELALHD